MFVSPLPTLEHVRFAKENTLGGDFMGLVMMIMTHCGQTVHQACAVISLLQVDREANTDDSLHDERRTTYDS